ncbi:MAG: hypothetical protein ABH843_06995 [Candidatus Omnitrophota bacterium]
MNCLALSSLIATKDGLKKITEIKEGEEVYAFDMKAQKLVLKRCSGVFDNGVKDVYELETLHHSIKATSNHPFLVAVGAASGSASSPLFEPSRAKSRGWPRNETGGVACQTKPRVYIWKTLEQVKIGDEVVTLKKSEDGFECKEVVSIKLIGKEPTLDLRVEDEHNFIANGIVVHNTGIQRSGATPCGASTTTAPAGKESHGKPQNRKNLTAIVAAHNIPYAAQANISNWNDLVTKSQKAFAVDGPAFLNIFALCHRGWRYPQENGVAIAKLATDTCFWPLYEIIDGKKIKITYKPKEKKPIIDWLKTQGRFKHLLKPENEKVVKAIQENIDSEWEYLLKRSEG